MGLTSALYSTLTGLNANQQRLDVIGNNISNVNTIGYKSSRLDFQTLFSQTVSNGSPPGSQGGGTNPFQIGLGTKEGAITTNFNDGSREITGVNTELAVEGNGFFVLQGQAGQTFSRDGTFKLNSDNKLVNSNGQFVQGYGVDGNFNVINGPLQDVTIPLGALTVAKATTTVTLDGTFNGTGTVATKATAVTVDQPIFQTDPLTSAVSTTAPTSATLLTNLVDSTNNPLFVNADVISVKGTKGTRSLTAKTLTVTPTTTLGDYQAFMTGALGINTTAGINGAAATPGVTVATPTQPNANFPANSVQLAVTGNLGTVDDINLASSDVSIKRVTAGVTTTVRPFTFSKAATSDGESVFTPVTVYDSLGSAVTLDVSAVLTSKGTSGTSWSYLLESPDGTGGSLAGQNGIGTNTSIGSGTLQFDNLGRFVSSTTPNVTIDRTGTGAVPALQFALSFGNLNALGGSNSNLAATSQDGSSKGNLSNFTIDDNGQVIGAFDNGVRRTLGQVVLATFRNNQGLISAGNNNFIAGSNSGLPVITAPGVFSTGKIVAGSLELSNVDLSAEFVNLISASTGFSASSKVITTSNQLLQDLLAAAR